jgi:CRISPR-associated protein Cas2
MRILVTYDVNITEPGGQRRLRRVAQVCVNHGQRVQKSVFECSLTPMQYEAMKYKLLEEIDVKLDNLRLYTLPATEEGRCESFGVQDQVDFDAPLVV